MSALNFVTFGIFMVVKFIKKKKKSPPAKQKQKKPQSIQETPSQNFKELALPGSVWPFCHVVDGDFVLTV